MVFQNSGCLCGCLNDKEDYSILGSILGPLIEENYHVGVVSALRVPFREICRGTLEQLLPCECVGQSVQAFRKFRVPVYLTLPSCCFWAMYLTDVTSQEAPKPGPLDCVLVIHQNA